MKPQPTTPPDTGPCQPILIATWRRERLATVQHRHTADTCRRQPCYGRVDDLNVDDWQRPGTAKIHNPPPARTVRS